MKIPGVKTAKTFSRWLQARIFGGALILGYHRIADVVRDEYEVCVTPEHFAEHMTVVSKYAHPISLSKLVRDLRVGSLPPRSIAVTFDDGYADNLYNAKPILEKYEVPATVFVCTGYTGGEFWWDELERSVMLSKTDLRSLRLKIGENSFVWNQLEVSPKAGSPVDVSIRRKFHHALYHFLLPLDVEDRTLAMNTIRNWSATSSDKVSESRSMSPAELMQLVDDGLIEIGAHTRFHPMLPHLSLERQHEEIISSKQDLEDLLGKRVDGFAYPNGKATEEARWIVREAGFLFACTSQPDMVRRGSDLHELTRFWQNDVDGDKFLRGLKTWL